MKLNKFTLSLTLTTLVLSSCARDEGHLWHAFLQSQIVRKPAQAPAVARPRCYLDRYNDQAIQDEVTTMQGQYAGGAHANFQRGGLTWNGLPQATIDALNQKKYLNVTGYDSWFTADVRQKDCTDLSCFADKLYTTTPATNEGLLHYWYFLKTGYIMPAVDVYPWFNADSTISEVHVTDMPLEQYLFTRDEWKALWLQESLLPKMMLHMPDLSSIHRLPHGYIPTDWQTSGVCGLSVGSYLSGYILLSDECLTLDDTNPLNSKTFFYASVTHELGHRLANWNLGRRDTAFDGMDTDPAFLALSDWTQDELVSATGATTREWKHTTDDTGWLSDYAKTSPHEDWAESVGYYRTNPSRELANAPKKYDYLKKNVFDGRGYAPVDLKVDYGTQVANELVSGVSDWAAPCLTVAPLQPTLTADQTALLPSINLDLPIEPASLACLKGQFVIQLTQSLSDIRYNEPEGCSTLDAPGVQATVIQNAITPATAGIMTFLQTDHRIADVIGGVQNFRASIATEYDGKAVYLSCYGQADPMTCFQTKVASEFERLYEKYKVQLTAGSDAIVDLERQRFIRMNGYADTQNQVNAFFTGLFSDFITQVDSSSQTVWQNCAAAPADYTLTDVSVVPYSAGVNYMAPSMLKCLNEGAVSIMADIRGKAATEHSIEVFTNDAKNWINTEVLFPRVKGVFDTAVQAAKALETTKLTQAKDAAVTASVTALTSDLSWEIAVGVYALPDCRVGAAKKLKDQLQVDQYRFTAVDPVITQWSDTVCEKVRVAVRANYQRSGNALTMDTGEVSAAQMAALDPVWDALKQEVKKQFQSRYAVCSTNRYPGAAQKRFCLYSQVVVDDQDHHSRTGWYWALHRALITWFALPAVDHLLSQKGYPDALARTIALKRLDNERQQIAADVTLDFLH